MGKNKDFVFDDSNYIDSVPIDDVSRSIGLFGHSSHKDFDKFENGVRPANGLRLHSVVLDENGKPKDPLIGKTINFYYFDEDKYIMFIGFTDGTFIAREMRDTNVEWDTSRHREPHLSWGDAYWINPDWCVFRGDPYKISMELYRMQPRKKDVIRITSIGRWLEEHTDMDIIGYYNMLVKEAEEDYEKYLQREKEDDRKTFDRLKEQYGWQ